VRAHTLGVESGETVCEISLDKHEREAIAEALRLMIDCTDDVPEEDRNLDLLFAAKRVLFALR